MPSVLGNNIIDGLVPVLDDVRQLVADTVGDHAYRLFRVVRTWSGTERGLGSPVEVETEILPSPVVAPKTRYQMQPGAKEEEGDYYVTEISLTYTEAEISLDGAAANVELFYRLKDRNGQSIAADDFILAGQPYPDRTKGLGWVLTLKRAQK